MYSYEWDSSTGGYMLTPTPLTFSKEPRPVYYKELDILGFDKYWNYDKNDAYPYMWAEANNYYYRGRLVAKTKGGSIYTAPELVLLEEPEPEGYPLRFVDIPAMVEKNRDILEQLVQDTIKKIYNTFIEYKKKVDVFYVAFSGGKDSIVTLDLVQRALPHNEFKVLFGDTGMEFPDTYDVVEKIKEFCALENIEFLVAQSEFTPECTWNKIGPPAQKMRWCCSVHKTAPQIMLMRKITNNPHFRGMAMMGVRADESVTRSHYDELSLGTKHKGQYDYYPILNWNSAELFLYIYKENLIMNETYKAGNSRAGCLVCPMEATKNTWFKEQSYKDGADKTKTTTFFNDIILDKTIAKNLPQKNVQEFMEIGVWKSRHNGQKLSTIDNRFYDDVKGDLLEITVSKLTVNWTVWMKTVGDIEILDDNHFILRYKGASYNASIEDDNGKAKFIFNIGAKTKENIYLMSCLKTVFRKSSYCIGCHVCEANCPHGFIKMKNGQVEIDDRCYKCQLCHDLSSGCVVAQSLMLPKEKNKMGSIDRYKNMGIKYSWVEKYFENKDLFWDSNHGLGSMMVTSLKAFLGDAGVTTKNKFNDFGFMLDDIGIDTELAWALMLCNLAYTSQFNWWIKNIEFNNSYSEDQIKYMLEDIVPSENSRKNIISGFKNIFYYNDILAKNLGLGDCDCEIKGKNLFLKNIIRFSWQNPDERVVLYSLYKFAEACGNYKQFTLTRLLDYSIESDGVSPTQIFGLSRETMEKILNGLTFNYPDLIEARFTLGLDNITLKSDKSAEEVLNELF